jgi:casein kinase I family protein HRR25
MITNNDVLFDKFSIGTVISNKYKLTRLITKGSFSSVYECEHILKNTKSVIKMESNETAKKLMQHEVGMYMSLQRSKVRVPRIKNTGNEGNLQYIILERLDKSLKEYDGVIHVQDLYRQLYLLHQEGIFHRDIKPDNFVVGFNQLIYIVDLGLSKHMDNKPTKGFLGNFRYASPICFKENYNYNSKDDIISITYMLLDLKYGFLPWDYEGYDKMLRQDIDFNYFYKDEPLCEVIHLCLNGFNYNQLFTILDKVYVIDIKK